MTAIKAMLDWLIAKVQSITVPSGWMATVWAWVSWAIVGLVTSIYNLFVSPKVWPAAILFGCVGWIAAFNFGQKVPDTAVAVPVKPAVVVDLQVCRTQLGAIDDRLRLATAEIAALKEREVRLQENLASKPKVVYRTRTAPAKPEQGISIDWPRFLK